MSTLQLLAAQKIPLEFGALRMDADGNLVETSATSLNFSFQIDSVTYDCVLNRVGANDLRIRAKLGQIPFSAENRQARVDVLALIHATKGAIPFGSIGISADQTVALDARITVITPMNPLIVITAVTEILRDSLPWSTAIRARLAVRRPQSYTAFRGQPAA
jgi:hypothetical protein